MSGLMSVPKRIPREKWIKEIPFDVADEWGSKKDDYDKLFPTREVFEQALKDAAELPPSPYREWDV